MDGKIERLIIIIYSLIMLKVKFFIQSLDCFLLAILSIRIAEVKELLGLVALTLTIIHTVVKTLKLIQTNKNKEDNEKEI